MVSAPREEQRGVAAREDPPVEDKLLDGAVAARSARGRGERMRSNARREEGRVKQSRGAAFDVRRVAKDGATEATDGR